MITLVVLFLLFLSIGLFSMAYAVFTNDKKTAEWLMEKSFAIAGLLFAIISFLLAIMLLF